MVEQQSSQKNPFQNGNGVDLKIDIGLVGNSSVGKTSLIQRFVKGASKRKINTLPTIGIDMQTIKIKFNNMTVKVNIWDPAGQDRFEALTKNYIQNIDAILLVFDMTDKGSLDSVYKWYDQIKNTTDKPILITGNKMDMQCQEISPEDIDIIQ